MIVPNSEYIGHIKSRPNYTRDKLTFISLKPRQINFFFYNTQGFKINEFFFQNIFLEDKLKSDILNLDILKSAFWQIYNFLEKIS